MRKLLGLLSALVLLSHVAVYAIATIKEVRLADGYEAVNTISAPLFDAAAVPPLNIGAIKPAFEPGAKIVRRGATGMFTKGPEYNLDKSVDLAALLTEALRKEAAAMGFRVSSSEGWQIGGTLKDIFLESKQIPYGATLFYGYMDVELTIGSPSGQTQTKRARFHSYSGSYNAGMGRKDEAESALAHLLVEGAQEALARLNREFLKAPARPEIAAKVKTLETSGASGHANDLYLVGLAGSAQAATAVLGLVPKETDENRRSALIEALGRLGSAEAVPALTARYDQEDEDCRWYILKAMDYIGTPEAIALVKERGVKDKDGGPRRLAQKIAGSS